MVLGMVVLLLSMSTVGCDGGTPVRAERWGTGLVVAGALSVCVGWRLGRRVWWCVMWAVTGSVVVDTGIDAVGVWMGPRGADSGWERPGYTTGEGGAGSPSSNDIIVSMLGTLGGLFRR